MDCFYGKGLDFQCQECGVCCGVDPGYVFLSESDIERLAHGLSIDRDLFVSTFCREVDMGSMKMISLIEKKNYDCIFLTKAGCSVYEYRPVQCATYPFWAHIVESRENWEEEARTCPGINKGRRHTKEEIENCLDSRLSNNPVVIL